MNPIKIGDYYDWSPLYYKGNFDLITTKDSVRVGIIGAREAPSSALKTIFYIADQLYEEAYRRGTVTIVTGLASGIDTMAHVAAIPSKTIGVVPNLDHIIPKHNSRLYSEIPEYGGLLVSPKIGMTNPAPQDYLTRDRLLVDMCDIIIVGYIDTNSRGTAYTLNYAKNKGTKKIYYNPMMDPKIVEILGGTEKDLLYDVGDVVDYANILMGWLVK